MALLREILEDAEDILQKGQSLQLFLFLLELVAKLNSPEFKSTICQNYLA